MTIQKCLDMVDRMKPNMMRDEEKLIFLNEIEGLVHDEMVMAHEHTAEEETMPVYDEDTDRGTALIVPAPYDMLYVWWLICKIDLMNMEYDKYNNDRALFENAYDQAGDWWTRHKMPIQKAREFRV